MTSWGSPTSPSITIRTGAPAASSAPPACRPPILIDRSGQEVGRLLGPAEWDSDEAIAVIETLVGPAAGDSEMPEESRPGNAAGYLPGHLR